MQVIDPAAAIPAPSIETANEAIEKARTTAARERDQVIHCQSLVNMTWENTNVVALLLNGQVDLSSEFCPLILPIYKSSNKLKCVGFTDNFLGEAILTVYARREYFTRAAAISRSEVTAARFLLSTSAGTPRLSWRVRTLPHSRPSVLQKQPTGTCTPVPSWLCPRGGRLNVMRCGRCGEPCADRPGGCSGGRRSDFSKPISPPAH